MDQRLRPVGIHEQIMRRADPAVEIAVGFIHDQRQPVRPRDLHKRAHHLGGVFRPARIVRRHQHNRAGARRDQRARRLRIRDHPRPAFERNSLHPRHIEPHFMIEIPRAWEDHLIPRARQRGKRCAECLIAALGDRHLRRRDLAAVGPRPLVRQFRAQGGQAQNRPVEMRLRILQRGARNRFAQGQRRGLNGGGLRDIDQRALGRELHPLQPAPRLHHRRRERAAQRGVQRMQGAGRSSGSGNGRRGGHVKAPQIAPNHQSGAAVARPPGPEALKCVAR